METTIARPQEAPAEAASSAAPAPQPEDRKQLDSRRVIARAIDALFVGAPVLIPVLDLGLTLSTVLVALTLAYFFVCEALWGQTLGKRIIGLRVVMLDGRPATATAVAVRTLLRLIDDSPFGLLVFLASGRRRQRLGDVLGGTIVARPTPGLPRAGLSPALLGYPAVLVGATAALVLVLAGPQARHDYLKALDSACAQRSKANAASRPKRLDLDTIVARKLADHRALAAVEAPAGARGLRTEVLALDARVDRALLAASAHAKTSRDPHALRAEVKPISAARQAAAGRYAQLGLRSCARPGVV
jgi:uncharacterized RDD family membrane protein YckC